MSILWLFALFIAQFAVAEEQLSHYSNLLGRCPSPIRPKHIMDNYNVQSDFLIRLNLVECHKSSTEKNYFFVKTFMRVDSRMILDSAFEKYQIYAHCPNCTIQITTDEPIEQTQIYIKCDKKVQECSIANWQCDELTQEKFGAKLMEMLRESVMKTPAAARKLLDFLPIFMFFCYYSVLGISINYLINQIP